MRVTSGGNIQIDSGELNAPKSLRFHGNRNFGGSYGNIEWYNYQWDGLIKASIAAETSGALSNGALVFRTSDGGVNATERMRIAGNGNVGINTTNASALLHIQKATAWGTMSNEIIRIENNGSGPNIFNSHNLGSISWYSGPSSLSAQISALRPVPASGEFIDLTFSTANGGTMSERMRINSGGQVQLRQSTNDFNSGNRFLNTASNYWGLVTGGDNNLYLGYNSNTVSVGVFNASTGVYTATSDINKKKDFENSTLGLSAIMGLKPTLYRMKNEDESSDKHLGFLAQEVKEYIPQAYSESINGDSTFIGLTEMPIIATLVKAIQEQQTLIQSLTDRLSALENK
jgi:hypothetical protein